MFKIKVKRRSDQRAASQDTRHVSRSRPVLKEWGDQGGMREPITEAVRNTDAGTDFVERYFPSHPSPIKCLLEPQGEDMTVKELREALKGVPGDMPVATADEMLVVFAQVVEDAFVISDMGLEDDEAVEYWREEEEDDESPQELTGTGSVNPAPAA